MSVKSVGGGKKWIKILGLTFLSSTLVVAGLLVNDTSRNFLFNSKASQYDGICESRCKTAADEVIVNKQNPDSCVDIVNDVRKACGRQTELMIVSNPDHYLEYQEAKKECEAKSAVLEKNYSRCRTNFGQYFKCMDGCTKPTLTERQRGIEGQGAAGSKTNYKPGTKFYLKNN